MFLPLFRLFIDYFEVTQPEELVFLSRVVGSGTSM